MYKCWNDIGNSEKVIGVLGNSEGITDAMSSVLLKYLTDADPLDKDDCKTCFYLPICGGGCPYERISNETGGKHFDTCDLMKDHIADFLKLHLHSKKTKDEKIINGLLLVSTILLNIKIANCQLDMEQENHLSVEQMQEDFAFLVKTMNAVNPQLSIREKLTGINPIAEAEAIFQKEIPSVQNFEKFYYLVHKVLCAMRDQHCRIYYVPEFLQKKLTHIPQIVYKKNSENFQEYDRYQYGGLFEFKFLKGKYYAITDYYGQTDKNEYILLPAGSEIITVNGKPILDVINSTNLTPPSRWYHNDKIYVNSSLFSLDEYGLGDSILFKVKLPNADTVFIDFTNRDLSTNSFLYTDYQVFKVELFPDGLLYIRIPIMDLEKLDYFKKEIEKYRKNKISKIVIDIRNNQGGNDKLWINLISFLISNPFEIKSEMVVRKSELVDIYLKKYHKNLSISKADAYRNNLLPDNLEYAKLPNTTITIKPNRKSLNYNGQIYLLVNDYCYSSALGFLSAIKGNKQFTSVGQRTGWFGGRGLTPFFFYLPNSNIVFSIEPVLDITGVKDVSQILQDAPDIEVNLKLEDYIFENSYKGERYSKYYLYNFDTTFKYILNNL